MTGAYRARATLALLAAVLVLGGASAAGFSANLLVQVLGAGLLAWTLGTTAAEAPLKTGLRPFFIALAGLMLVQFLPLPPALWRGLPGRDAVYQGFAAIHAVSPWLSVSLAPWHSLASFAWWIPALALFVALRAPAPPPLRAIVWTVTGLALVAVLLGAVQRLGGNGYLYFITNYGEGPGFFANSNHQGSFLLCALALWGGWIAHERAGIARRRLPDQTEQGVMIAVALVLVAGILVSGSLACVALLFPVLIALGLIAFPGVRAPVWLVIIVMAIVVAGFGAFLLFGPVANDLTAKGVVGGISRKEFLGNGLHMLRDFAPLGSGTGTFVDLYRWYENPDLVGLTFVNHTHDDLLEVLIETGAFGLVAVVLFLVWYVPRAWRLWTERRDHPIALAASVIIAVELLHSLVDYPLRTAAMSSIMAMACVLDRKSSAAVRAPKPETDENHRGMIRI